MSKAFKPIGLPCVGGKTKLAPILKEVIEKTCLTEGISTYISACGGGGKDILALNPEYFDKLIYNEIEKPVAMLMRALTQVDGLYEIHKEVDKIFERALSVETYGDLSDNRKREARMRFMFDYIYNLYANDYTDKLGVDENPDDLFTIAAHGVILIYGSIQSNRKNILYRDKDGKHDFYKSLYEHSTYIEKLNKIREKASAITAIHGNCFPLIEKYKSHKDTLIYIDPPYWNCSNDYTNTFSFDDHIKLTEMCADAECKIMISMHEAGIAPYVSNLGGRDGWYMYELKPISHSTIGRNVIKKSKQAMLWEASPIMELLIDSLSLMPKIELIKAVGTDEYSKIRQKMLDEDASDRELFEGDLHWLERYDNEEINCLSEIKLNQLKNKSINGIINDIAKLTIDDILSDNTTDAENNVSEDVVKNKLDKMHEKAEMYSKTYANMKKIIKDRIDYRIDAVTEYVFSNFEIDHEDFQLITINNDGEYPVFRESEGGYFSDEESVYDVIIEAIPRIFLEKYSKFKEKSNETDERQIKGFTADILSDATVFDAVGEDVRNTLSNLYCITSGKYEVSSDLLELIENKKYDTDSAAPPFNQLLYKALFRQKLEDEISGIIRKDTKERKAKEEKAKDEFPPKELNANDDKSKGSVKKILKQDRCKEMLERMEKAMETM